MSAEFIINLNRIYVSHTTLKDYFSKIHYFIIFVFILFLFLHTDCLIAQHRIFSVLLLFYTVLQNHLKSIKVEHITRRMFFSIIMKMVKA